MAAASLREQMHELVDALPEEELVAADRFLRFLRAGARLIPPESGTATPLPEPERQARVRALKGKYAGKLSRLEEFSRMRQEEIDLEEARWTPQTRGSPDSPGTRFLGGDRLPSERTGGRRRRGGPAGQRERPLYPRGELL